MKQVLLHVKFQTHIVLRLFLLTVMPAFISYNTIAQKQSNGWKSLFNGKDLSNWGTYLRPSEAPADKQPIGLNKDPHGVFTVDNGMIHISGQDWGGMFTNESYSNYHLRFDVRFGEKKWAPRENVVADGGLLFHCSLPYDFGSTCWMRSLELQIQETDVADYHNVGAGIPEIQISKGKDGNDPVDQYDPSAPFQLTKNRVYRSTNFESPHGEWTKVDLVARGADAVFIVNGFVVNRIYNIYRTDLNEQTTSGQLQFQSEGAEHFLRDIQLRSIDFNVSKTPKLASNKNEIAINATPQQLQITNQGDAVELIGAELLGKNLEAFIVKLPAFPMVLAKGGKISIPVSVKPGYAATKVQLKLETVLGPVKNFSVLLSAQ
ncbi:3-keto-disaccharide hydrolase [Segetibacter aerophilus]|nr:DUF1080 domain-containing protein [Segetibacter aerophilus]